MKKEIALLESLWNEQWKEILVIFTSFNTFNTVLTDKGDIAGTPSSKMQIAMVWLSCSPYPSVIRKGHVNG